MSTQHLADKLSNFLPESIHNVLRPKYENFMFSKNKKKMLRFYSNFISEGDLVYDVGAHVGYFTEVFLELGAKVVCVDPQPYCIKNLKGKFKENNVVIIEKGLSSEIGKLELSINKKRPGTSTFSESWKNISMLQGQSWTEKITVPVTTLDFLIKEFGLPKFCKIDVEGHESKVLKGLNSKINFISFEFATEFFPEIKLCIESLSTIGNIELNYSQWHDFELKLQNWLTPDLFYDQLKHFDGVGDIYVRIQ